MCSRSHVICIPSARKPARRRMCKQRELVRALLIIRRTIDEAVAATCARCCAAKDCVLRADYLRVPSTCEAALHTYNRRVITTLRPTSDWSIAILRSHAIVILGAASAPYNKHNDPPTERK